jgi:Na+/H+ antiporter NhaC
MECLPEGFRSMVPAMLILTFAWTLKTMTDSLGAGEFVNAFVTQYAGSFSFLLPAIIFLIAIGISFATGTSWGTFGILIPIVVSVFEKTDPQMMVIAISACMAGSVCGDHCSPISDTTIMASAGAKCKHVKHVSTQLPYSLLVAVISFIMYILVAFIRDPFVSLAIGIALTIGALFLVRFLLEKKEASAKSKE